MFKQISACNHRPAHIPPVAKGRGVVCRLTAQSNVANCGTRRHDGGCRVGGYSLITVPELSAEALGSFLSEHLNQNFGSTHAHLAELIPSIARIALECIGNSDALYHNVEHTMLVTL